MQSTRHNPFIVCTLGASLFLLVSCSDSNESSQSTPDFEPDTSYLDELDAGTDSDTQEALEESTATIDDDQPAAVEEQANEAHDEEREWVEDEGSRSLLGRARDRARDVGDQVRNSTSPERGLADTIEDEEYAQAAGHAWDMQDGWRMAIPAQGRFAEMYIQHPLGNASIAFTKESESPNAIKRRLESSITDIMTGRSRADTSSKTVLGFPVTIYELTGTYIDPSSKGTSNGNPFYAIRAAVIQLPTTNILIKLWGPEDTVKQNAHKFDSMIEKMYSK